MASESNNKKSTEVSKKTNEQTKSSSSSSTTTRVKNPRTLWLILRIVLALLLMVTGVLALMNKGEVIFILCGCFLIADGVVRILRYYLDPARIPYKARGVLVSSLETAIGVVLCFNPGIITQVFDNIFAIFLAGIILTLGLVFLVDASIRLYKGRYNKAQVIVYFITAVILLVGGILIIVFADKIRISQVLLVILGVLLIIGGILLIIDGFTPIDKIFKKLKAK